jgi:hypothetical protein
MRGNYIVLARVPNPVADLIEGAESTRLAAFTCEDESTANATVAYLFANKGAIAASVVCVAQKSS